MRLEKRRIALLITGGYHEHEFWFPYYRFREEGAEVVVGGPVAGIVYGEGRHGTDGLPAEVTHTVEQVAAMEIDALYLPGGIYSPLALRAHRPTLELVRNPVEGASRGTGAPFSSRSTTSCAAASAPPSWPSTRATSASATPRSSSA